MSSGGVRELLVFEVSGVNFALELAKVEEVVPANVITLTPNAPPFLLGLSAVRGKVVGVIDASLRYGLPQGVKSYFLVCLVRGNITAVTIDHPVLAGTLSVRSLSPAETQSLQARAKVDPKFLKGAFELHQVVDDKGSLQPSGIFCLEIDPDLFVSDGMASRVGEAS